MQTFGLSTSSLFSAGLATLILITFLAGLVKVWFNKRDLKKKIKLANLEAANERTDKEKLVGDRELDEGDLFGVRAIQAGFFGGVSQSCPNSPSISRSSSLCSVGPKVKIESTPKPSLLGLQPPSPARTKASSCEKINISSAPSSPPQQRCLSPTDRRPLENQAPSFEANSKSVPRIQLQAENALPSILRIQNRMDNNASNPRSPKPVLQTKAPANLNLEKSSSLPNTSSPNLFTSQCSTPLPGTSQSPNTRPKSPPRSIPGRSIPPEDRDFPRISISLSSLANLPRTLSPTAVIRDSVVSKQKVSIYQPPSTSSIESAHQSTIENRLSRVATSSSPPPDILTFAASTNPTSKTLEKKNSNLETRRENPFRSEKSPKMDICQEHSTSDFDSGSLSLSQETDSTDSRYSPCSSSHTTSRSSSSSLSSVLTTHANSTTIDIKPPMISPLEFQPLDDSSSSEKHNSRLSQGSIGDFYDTYYRRSVLRQSVLEQAREIELGWREKSGYLQTPHDSEPRKLVSSTGPKNN